MIAHATARTFLPACPGTLRAPGVSVLPDMQVTSVRIVHIGRAPFAAWPVHRHRKVTRFPAYGPRSPVRNRGPKFENGVEHDADSAVRFRHMGHAGAPISASGKRAARHPELRPRRHRAHGHSTEPTSSVRWTPGMWRGEVAGTEAGIESRVLRGVEAPWPGYPVS